MTIKDKTIKENNEKIEHLTKSVAEFKVQLAQQKQKYEKQLTDLKNKVGLLQTAVDNKSATEEYLFQKINTDGNVNINNVVGMSGSAKANSRSINVIHRQVNNKQSNRGHGSQIVISNTHVKTPLAAQTTGATTGSQKHLQLAMKEHNGMIGGPNKPQGNIVKSQANLKQNT